MPTKKVYKCGCSIQGKILMWVFPVEKNKYIIIKECKKKSKNVSLKSRVTISLLKTITSLANTATGVALHQKEHIENYFQHSDFDFAC